MVTSRTDVGDVLRGAKPAQTVEEAQAFSRVFGTLVGRPPRPVTISRYVLLERLGAGGAGVVYRAYDPELDRKVAVKLLRAGADSGEARMRLIREGRAIARLSHPNIVAVHDVGSYGTADLGGQSDEARDVPGEGVFVVMELVEGASLATWLRATRGVREVLDVFLAAGEALASAHSMGLIHRDFKPGNVLVGTDGRPRVLDFGLARALESSSDTGRVVRDALGTPSPQQGGDPDKTLELDRSDPGDTARMAFEPTPMEVSLTATGALMGTPLYMAPEQHEGRDTDERTDQFAFCASLYEGLYGEAPFEGVDLETLARAKRGFEVRPAPDRSRVPLRLRRIVLRGLSYDPQDRFPDMQSLLAELRHDPAAVRRRILSAALVVVALFIVASGFFAWQRERERSCEVDPSRLQGVWDDNVREAASRAFMAIDQPYVAGVWDRVTVRLDAYVDRWVDAQTTVCKDTVVRGDVRPEVMTRRMLCLDRCINRVTQVTQEFREADAVVAERAVQMVSALPSLDACLGELEEDAAVPDDPELRTALLAIAGELGRAETLRMRGAYDESAAALETAQGQVNELGYTPLHARTLSQRGVLYRDRGDVQQAEQVLHAAFVAAERARDDHLATEALVELVSVVGPTMARYDEADRLAEHAAAKLDRHDLGPTLRARFATVLGDLRRSQGRLDEAEAAYLEAQKHLEAIAGATGPRLAEIHEGRGAVAAARGDYTQSGAQFQAARDIWIREVGDQHPRSANALYELGRNAQRQRRPKDAHEMMTRALETMKSTWGEAHPKVAKATEGLGYLYLDMGRSDDALATLRRAERMLARAYRPQHPWVAYAIANQGVALWQLGRLESAHEHAQRSARMLREELGDDHVVVRYVTMFDGRVLHSMGRSDEARPLLEEALAFLTHKLGRNHPRVVEALDRLIRVDLDTGHPDRARSRLEEAHKIAQAIDLDAADDASLRFLSARALWPTDPALALERAREAAAIVDGLSYPRPESVEIARWLAEHDPDAREKN